VSEIKEMEEKLDSYNKFLAQFNPGAPPPEADDMSERESDGSIDARGSEESKSAGGTDLNELD